MTDIPPKIYVNVYRPFAASVGSAYASKDIADQMAARGRIALVEVDTAAKTATIIEGQK